MCVARPARVVWIGNATEVSIPGRVLTGDDLQSVDLVMVPDARVGDHVITHSGYAIRIASEVPPAEVERHQL